MKISEVSKQTGLSESTIRYYEKSGVFDPIARGADGQRRFKPQDLKNLQILSILREAGMPLEEMRTFLTLCSSDVLSHEERKSLLESHLARLLARRKRLDSCLDLIRQKLEKYH